MTLITGPHCKRVSQFLNSTCPLSYTWCFPLTHAEGKSWHPSQFCQGSTNFNYCQSWLSATFLTWELRTKTGVNKLLFPPLWLQPDPWQKFPSAQFPALVGSKHNGKGRGTFQRSSSAVLTCRHWIFLTIPALREKLLHL